MKVIKVVLEKIYFSVVIILSSIVATFVMPLFGIFMYFTNSNNFKINKELSKNLIITITKFYVPKAMSKLNIRKNFIVKLHTSKLNEKEYHYTLGDTSSIELRIYYETIYNYCQGNIFRIIYHSINTVFHEVRHRWQYENGHLDFSLIGNVCSTKTFDHEKDAKNYALKLSLLNIFSVIYLVLMSIFKRDKTQK